MSKLKPKYIILLLFLIFLFLICGIYTEKKAKNNYSYSINLVSFQKTLNKKFEKLHAVVQNITSELKNNSYQFLFQDKNSKAELLENDFIILVYKNKELVYWSDNSYTFPVNYDPLVFEKKIHSFDNAWLVSTENRIEEYHIIGCALIKQNFSYENKFLKNSFQKDFNIDPATNISKVPTSYGYAVKDFKGEFLFSLVPDFSMSGKNNWLYLSLCIYLACLLTILAFIYITALKFRDSLNSNLLFFIAVADLVIIRFLMIKFQFPEIFYHFDLFKPENYASSFWLPSLGDFLINAIFVVIIAFLFKHLIKFNLKKSWQKHLFSALFSIGLVSFFYIIVSFLTNLINNSNIPFEFHNILNISPYSVVAILIFSILIISFLIVAFTIIKYIIEKINIKYSIIYIFSTSSILFICLYSAKIYPDWFSIFFFLISISLLTTVISFKKIKFNFTVLVIFTLLISLFIVLFINHYNFINEKEKRKVLVVNLSNERDPIGELQLEEFESKLKDDQDIKNLLIKQEKDQDIIYKHLMKKYFHGYWGKYDLIVTSCDKKDSLEIQPTEILYNCYDFFNENIQRDGIPISNTNFYYLDNNNGRISYLGKIPYFYPEDSTTRTLFIDLNSRLISTELGYPELLLEKKVTKSTIDQYAYAKYKDNELISQSGDYSYSLNARDFQSAKNEFTFLNFDGYNHLVYKTDNNEFIILSKPVVKTIDVVTSLSYIFILNFIIMIVYMIMHSLPIHISQFNLKNRIQISMIFLLFVSLLFVGGGSIYYNMKQYTKNHFKNISEKTQSVLVELEHKIGDFNTITTDDLDYISYYLIKFSNVFYSDINLYDLNGNLLASSRPEIFNKGLISKKMDPEAFYQISINNKAEYIHHESIGEMNYMSAYVPFQNNLNQQLAYLNLPYFTKQNQIRAEISTLIVAIINSYLLLFIVTAFVAVIISNNVTRPIRLIQRRFREIQLGKQNEKLIYNRKDEIGELVQEYNRMVDEITKSAEILAKSERESAWREMAKQIAHEIKNPLTPMKLSVQHLQRAWQNKSENYSHLHTKVTQTLIEQIDSLSSIATEFSMFAKMPKTKKEELNLINKVRNAAGLFEDFDNVKISIHTNRHKKLMVFSDKEQITRVFNNLIQNAIQAIPDERDGHIEIIVEKDNENVIVAIRDNGCGIAEDLKDKLFQPNFTTKTSGMGLGLAMVKSIIEDMNGKIWFDTKLNEGSTFYISLPLTN